MEETEPTNRKRVDKATRGFRISDQPVVESTRSKEQPTVETSPGLDELPSSYGRDLLYVIARDPKSLFLYWDLDWTKLFAQAGMSARQVHLRVFREDDSEEATMEIDPFASHCNAAVGAAGARYYCELGCFDENEWKSLIRSATTTTPEAEMSEDFSAAFATLPLHLSFQRMIETLEETASSATVAGASDLALRVAAAEEQPGESPEMLEQWKQLGERYGGSSWGGPSSIGFGQSSRA